MAGGRFQGAAGERRERRRRRCVPTTRRSGGVRSVVGSPANAFRSETSHGPATSLNRFGPRFPREPRRVSPRPPSRPPPTAQEARTDCARTSIAARSRSRSRRTHNTCLCAFIYAAAVVGHLNLRARPIWPRFAYLTAWRCTRTCKLFSCINFFLFFFLPDVIFRVLFRGRRWFVFGFRCQGNRYGRTASEVKIERRRRRWLRRDVSLQKKIQINI